MKTPKPPRLATPADVNRVIAAVWLETMVVEAMKTLERTK